MSDGEQVNITPTVLICSQHHQPGSHARLHPQVLGEIGGVSEPAWAAAHRTRRQAPPGTEKCPLSITEWETQWRNCLNSTMTLCQNGLFR